MSCLFRSWALSLRGTFLAGNKDEIAAEIRRCRTARRPKRSRPGQRLWANPTRQVVRGRAAHATLERRILDHAIFCPPVVIFFLVVPITEARSQVAATFVAASDRSIARLLDLALSADGRRLRVVPDRLNGRIVVYRLSAE